jgi:hypothetical protein
MACDLGKRRIGVWGSCYYASQRGTRPSRTARATCHNALTRISKATVKWSVLEFHAEQAVAWDEYREAMRIPDKSLIRITPLRGGPIATGV